MWIFAQTFFWSLYIRGTSPIGSDIFASATISTSSNSTEGGLEDEVFSMMASSRNGAATNAENDASEPTPIEPFSDVDMGNDAYDWIHVYQFRRGHHMRHCFTRWSSYRILIGGIAHTWDVHRDDVSDIVEMRSQPEGIPRSAHAVIVKILGDDFDYDTRLHVLVDIELHQPVHFVENPILDRQVQKFPFRISRQGVLQVTQTEGLCHSRLDRCLVTHNGRLLPLQHGDLHEVRSGDYYVIRFPSLEDVLSSFPVAIQSRSLLQLSLTGTRRPSIWNGLSVIVTEQALGSTEEATSEKTSPLQESVWTPTSEKIEKDVEETKP